MVYVLLQFYIEDTNVIGVFGTIELGKKAKKDMEKITAEKYYSYAIEERRMNQLCIEYH